MSPTAALQISAANPGAVLTPAQKRFNTLIRQIDQARQTLAAWQDATGAYRQAHAQVLRPLEDGLVAGQKNWIRALDVLLEQRSWTKSEGEMLRMLLCSAARDLLEARGDDAELKALYDKHAELDFDAEQRRAMLAMKDFGEAVMGLDLGDGQEFETEADLFARMQKELQERAAAEEAERTARSARRRKTAAQLRREVEAQQVTQSLREIYRKLASALHPDRETDAGQRAEKTALMQRVNQAYEANDLLALLELQLQIEQIDASHIAGASEDRLKHYNKVLAEQLAELKAQVERVEMDFCLEFGLRTSGGNLQPGMLGALVEEGARRWRAELNEQQRQLRMFDDVAATKRWLKRQKQAMRGSEGFSGRY